MTLWTGTASTISAGQTAGVSTALATYRDAIKAVSEAWTTYTHGWSGTLGNGTIVAKYARVNKLIHYRVELTWGSTTSHAAANQSFALPAATHADYTADMSVGAVGMAFDISAAARNMVTGGWLTSTTFYVVTATGTVLTNAAPWTWATGDKLSISGTYETA